MTDTAESAPGTAPYPDKWPRVSGTPIVEHYHTAIRRLVAERFAASGKAWQEVVHDPALELTREDFEKIEADLLATGYRFEVSAVVSLKEEPEKYKPVTGHAESGAHETDEEGRSIVGSGDNVFRAKADVSGTARFISKVETVMEMLTDGVPAATIAIIDDSGGTLTAPILGDFAGVVCMGGTTRSHLGILTREYGVPCLMAAVLDGLREGDEVTVEYSKPAADAYADAETARAQRARIIKTS
jgi:PEP-utilising enzyme, mobile domain